MQSEILQLVLKDNFPAQLIIDGASVCLLDKKGTPIF